MSNQEESFYLERCCKLIEQKLAFGSSETWTNRNFEKLSENILEACGVHLSISTLKRIWGKVKYESSPSLNTLNTLSQYLGKTSWNEFKESEKEFTAKESHPVQHSVIIPQTPLLLKSKKNKEGRLKFLFSLFLFGAISVLLFSKIKKPDNATKHGYLYKFSSRKVASGIPNSVVFQYQASGAPSDSVFIQQSWDPSRRTLVNKKDSEHTSIYYYPGFFKAKLSIGDQVVQEHELFIPSNGWVAAIEQEPIPIYLDQQEFLKDSQIQISGKNILSHGIALEPRPPTINISQVRNMDGLTNDNFTFETTVKNTYFQGSAICQRSEIIILCKNDAFIIPLVAKGCVGNLALYIAGEYVSSEQADLSIFGCNLSEWTKVKIVSKNKHVSISLNGGEAYGINFHNPTAEIVGVRFRFAGSAMVKETKFCNANAIYNY